MGWCVGPTVMVLMVSVVVVRVWGGVGWIQRGVFVISLACASTSQLFGSPLCPETAGERDVQNKTCAVGSFGCTVLFPLFSRCLGT